MQQQPFKVHGKERQNPLGKTLLQLLVISQRYNNKGLACMQINVPVLDKLEQNNIPVLQWNIMDKDSKQMLPANEKKSKN
jgi:hypothetical protein